MLREDYQYNLKVVSERDNELKKCDNRISKLSTVDIFEWNVDEIDDFSNESNWRKLSNANKEFESYLLPLISSVQARTHYTKEYIRNMGLCEFMDQVSRLQIIVSADALLHGMYGGFIDTKKINKKELNWMRESTQNESDGMVINEGSQSVGSN